MDYVNYIISKDRNLFKIKSLDCLISEKLKKQISAYYSLFDIKVEFNNIKKDHICYSDKKLIIHGSSYMNIVGMFSVIFHEITHSTMLELNRRVDICDEEVIAEITSCILLEKLGFEYYGACNQYIEKFLFDKTVVNKHVIKALNYILKKDINLDHFNRIFLNKK